MKILFFHPLTGHLWRGIERTVVCLTSSLADLGHETSILTLRHSERALLEELETRVKLFEVPSTRYYAYRFGIPFFVAHLLRHRYDAVITFFGGFGVGASLYATRCFRRPPVYLHLCYPIDLVPHRYAELERWRVPERAAGIWAASDHVAAQASQRFNRPVRTVPSAVDTALFRQDRERGEQARAALGIGRDELVILTVAALNERKGIQHVLNALPLVRETVPSVKYLVAGEGEYEHELRMHIDRLNLRDTVCMLGAHRHVEQLYQAADVFCLLSHGEANPMVVHEALSSKLPAVTLSCPPFPSVLNANVAELLPSADSRTVAQVLIGLLLDRARRERMGEAGRRLVEERSSFTSLATLVAGLIETGNKERTPAHHVKPVQS